METSNSHQTQTEKKSERLDVRVSHSTKQAFAQACEDQGDTPSHAVRRFVSSYIRRARRDSRRAGARRWPWRPILGATTALLLLGAGGWWVLKDNAQKEEIRIADAVFKVYDENGNSLLDLGEIDPDDFHLHRVMNIDGVDGISRDEFYVEGRMVWRFVNADTFEILDDKDGPKGHFSRTRHVIITSDTPPPTGDNGYIKMGGKDVELTGDPEIDLPRLMESDVPDFQTRRQYRREGHFPSSHMFRQYATKVVEFDLHNPDTLEFTVFEQHNYGSMSSLSGLQRMVTWVDGRSTPELVMGDGREKAMVTGKVEQRPEL